MALDYSASSRSTLCTLSTTSKCHLRVYHRLALVGFREGRVPHLLHCQLSATFPRNISASRSLLLSPDSCISDQRLGPDHTDRNSPRPAYCRCRAALLTPRPPPYHIVIQITHTSASLAYHHPLARSWKPTRICRGRTLDFVITILPSCRRFSSRQAVVPLGAVRVHHIPLGTCH